MQLFENRYAKLALLTVGMAVLIYAVLWIVFMALGVNDFPQFLLITVSVLGSGLLVYKFLAGRVF